MHLGIIASIAQISGRDARILSVCREANEALGERASVKSSASIWFACTDNSCRLGSEVKDASVSTERDLPVERTNERNERRAERVSDKEGDIQPRIRSFSRAGDEDFRWLKVVARPLHLASAAEVRMTGPKSTCTSRKVGAAIRDAGAKQPPRKRLVDCRYGRMTSMLPTAALGGSFIVICLILVS